MGSIILFTLLATPEAPGPPTRVFQRVGVEEPCSRDALALMASAAARAGEFDLPGALPPLDAASAQCADAQVAAIYVRGLLAAREAAARGGTVESLAPIRSAVHEIARVAGASRAPAAIAELVLQAAIAASQYERDEMAIFLRQATDLEKLQLGARASGAPILPAHETAAELWLQVHRFEDARRAYREAQDLIGSTGRVLLGLARSAAHLNQPKAACAEYSNLIAWWKSRREDPPEITEAWQYVASAACAAQQRR